MHAPVRLPIAKEGGRYRGKFAKTPAGVHPLEPGAVAQRRRINPTEEPARPAIYGWRFPPKAVLRPGALRGLGGLHRVRVD